jgi:hypothetical protein
VSTDPTRATQGLDAPVGEARPGRTGGPPPRLARSQTVLAVAGALGLVLLAMVETLQALLAPHFAPSPADWKAAAAEVRSGFRAGDLIVAAPAWADPILRMHLGDLITIPMAARMDDARYGRVWEIAQRGAHAPEARGATVARQRFGALTLRLVQRPPAIVTYDFLAHWKDARVTRWQPVQRVSMPCAWQGGERFSCPGGGSVRRELVEVDTRIREALLAPPPVGAILAIEFPEVALGRELIVTAGLHDVWARKYGRGTVNVEVWVAGQPVTSATIGNRSGWHPIRVDTAARDGQTASVRVQISSPDPSLRNLAFAAEARR